MMTRSNDKNYKEKHTTYQNTECCKEWNEFSNFFNWMKNQENFERISTDEFHLDKDIILKGNKLYHPSLCCLVPQRVNKLFTKRDNKRGKYPIGVRKKNQKFEARCSDDGKSIYLGVFNTIEEAFNAYKNCKENIIKKVAEEEYKKGNIVKQCYESMMRYIVEITD